ncbi:ABC transporter permease [Aestuariibacter sp. AA17]|uniref:ABC transporter permease n=1 Tax=Fluctibacter corallii TaxID=2984329 RepID=A0ABT3A5G0_9ALTE|nr:ABC transporter permease [Aestuariibacter sp. AA17]MCV2883917.1 ABC transporter permease [Aestuariibacter sp. AA17]
MFSYYLRLAFKSMGRNPILSALMVAAIALGIGASMTTITVNYMMSSNPIPEKSEQLFYVQVDNWSPHNPYDDETGFPPTQLTWRDANNLYNAQQGTRQTIMAKSGGVVQPDDQDVKPFEAAFRLATNEFFAMFNVPFLFGSGWDTQADKNREHVVVITKQINERVFGGDNSVGRELTIAGHTFKVIGVLDTWQPIPKFYDVENGAFEDIEDVFMPFLLKEELELPSWGNTSCWKPRESDGFHAFLNSECINFQMWVELLDANAESGYLAFLNNYVNEQKSLGRFPRPLNNKLSHVMEWMEISEVVEEDAKVMMWLSLMFLTVCLLNTIGLLLAKFSSKSSEIGLRRAVGASKKDLFYQHTVETACIGLLGGLLGLVLALLGLTGIKSLYGDFATKVANFDFTLVLLGLLLALISSIAAGLYPTWRACNIQPASQLKSQ